MDSLQFYGDHLDENEEAEEESAQLQPDFSVNDVEIEVVSVVVETQELEVEEAVTLEKSTHDGENNVPYVEGRNDLGSIDLDGESADPKVVPEAEEGPQAAVPADQVPELVDLNRDTHNNDLKFTDTGGDELMAEQDEAPLEGDTEAMEATDDVTTILQQTEADGEHAVTSGGVANGESGVDLNTSDMEASDHQLPPEPATDPATAVLDDGLPVEDSLKVPAELAENNAIVIEDEKETESSEHLDTQTISNEDANENQTDVSEHADSGKKQTNSDPEDVTKSDDESVSAGDSAASKEILNVNVDLGSASAPEQLFSDASLAQLKAQILVMGILRKGSKPSDGLLNSACPTGSEGTPSATVAEDVDNVGGPTPGDPSSSRKRKSLDNETIPSDNDGIATGLMMAVKNNLHLSPTQDVFLLDDTDRQLRSAQISAHDAMATATSALAQSHLAWAQIRCEDHSAPGIAREQQIASVAATVAAAASVAKAAVEAAKAIANVSMKAFVRGGQIVSGQPSDKGKKKSLPTRRKSDMLASVVKAAGMAAEAATQAGTALTFANPLIPAGSMEGLWTREAGEANDADAKAYRAVKKKTKVPLRSKATKKSKGRVSAPPKRAPLTVAKSGSRKKNEVSKPSSRTRKDNRQPASPAKSIVSVGDLVEARAGGDVNEKSEFIAKGSVVEIITDEEGLRGGWFSGKILKVTKEKALAVYDELLDDDGITKIQEWLPFKASGDPAGPRRQVRPVHPYSLIRETGSKKRRRVAMGSQTWTLGDRVDAYIQDAWWEGELVELNDIDESKATVHFPGENDTQVVKVWDLRPSMQWEDGKWVPWASSVTEDEPPKTQVKAGSSSSKAKDKSTNDNVPKLTAKAIQSKEIAKKLVKTSLKKSQDISAKAAKAKEISKKTEDFSKEVNEALPSRSTRQATVQGDSANVPKVKKNSKNIQVSASEIDDPTPSTSTRKRKGPEVSASDEKGKKKPRVLEDPVDVPASRPTRSSLRDTTISAKDTGGKLSPQKLSDKRTSSGKKAVDTSKASQKDTTTLEVPKQIDLNVNTRSSTKNSSPSNVTTTNTRGKFKAEAENKRPRRR